MIITIHHLEYCSLINKDLIGCFKRMQLNFFEGVQSIIYKYIIDRRNEIEFTKSNNNYKYHIVQNLVLRT